MSAPIENQPGRRVRLRRWGVGGAVTVAVLALALAVLAQAPRSATATASLTVTPRTDAGAEAALLLADRYTALAGSVGTLRAARDEQPALADVSLDQLVDGTTVHRADGAATIAVRVALPDRDSAAAAANAVVDTLVQAGSSEQLVDVDRAAEASASRAVTSPDRLRWTAVALVLALACGLAAATLAGRRPARSSSPGEPPAAAGAEPAEVLDDLPGFLENPPGSIPVSAAAAVTGPQTGSAAPVDGPAPLSGRGAAFATVTGVALLAAVAVLVAVTTRTPRDEDGGMATATAAGSTATASATAGAAGTTATASAPTEPAAPGPAATVPPAAAPASAGETPAAALAFQSVTLGEDGVAASVTFTGVVLEQRAVGLTVTYPSLSVSTDGRRSLAHVRLPTFNCLTPEPPADPLAAGCARSLTEYADLAGPQLQVTRDGDRLDVVGLFPTYLRSNGSAPAYTGRAYQLTAAITADGPAENGAAPAEGLVRVGLDSAPTTADRGVNLVQFPG